MANPFDQFDNTQQEKNPFDQFDSTDSSKLSVPQEAPQPQPKPDPVSADPQYDENGVDSPSAPPSLDNYTPENIHKEQNQKFNGLATTSMYDDIPLSDKSEADRRYKQAEADPRNKNNIVLRPSEPQWDDLRNLPVVGKAFDNGPYAVPMSTKVVSGVTNGLTEMAKTGAGLVDTGMNAIYDGFGLPYKSEGAKFIDQNVPEVKAGDAGDEFLQQVPQMAVGGYLGQKLAGASNVSKYTQDKGRFIKTLGFVLNEATAAGGAASALPADTPTLLFGKDNKLGQLWNPDKDADYNEKMLSQKLNVMADGFAAAGLGVPVAKLGGFITKFFKNQVVDRAVNAFGTKSPENRMFDMMVSQVSDLENMNNEQKQDAAKKITQIVQDHKDLVLKGVDDAQNVNVELDPMSALEAGLRAKGDIKSADRVKLQRDSIFNMKSRGASGKMTEYREGVDELNSNNYSALGGNDSVDNARAGIVRSGQQEVGSARAAAENAQIDLENGKDGILNTLQNDPTFGNHFKDIQNATGININEGANNTVDQIATRLVRARDIMKNAKDDAAKALPDNLSIDTDSLEDVLINFNEKDQYNALPKILRDRIKRSNGESDSKEIDLSGLDFKFLNNEVVPQLSKKIQSAINSNQSGLAENLIDLKNNITREQSDFVSQNLENTSADFSSKWNDWLNKRDSFYDAFGAGDLKQLGKNVDETIPGKTNSERVLADKNSSLVSNAFNENKRNQAQTISEILASDEGGRSSELIPQYIVGTAAKDLGSTIRTKGIDSIDPESIIQTLQNKSSTLARDFPQQSQAIDGLVTQLTQQKNDLPKFQETLDLASQNADRIHDSVMNKELARFFGKTGGEITDSQAVFDDILKSNKASDELNTLMQRAENSDHPELIKEGLQAAFAKHVSAMVKDDSFDKSFIRNRRDDLVNYASILFKDKPSVVEGTKAAFDLAQNTAIKDAPENLVGRVPQQVYTEASDAIGKIITATFGVLNHLGAVVRGSSKTILDSYDPAAKLRTTLDAMYSDPDTFFKLGDQYVKSLNKGIGVQKVADNFTRYMSKYAVMKLGSPQDDLTQTTPDKEDQTEEAFGIKENPRNP